MTELYLKKLRVETRKLIRDDRGLYIEAHPNGNKFWKYRYKENGKEKKISLGQYPHVGLHEARQKRDEIQGRLAVGEAPTNERL